jgi:hypothetical protein
VGNDKDASDKSEKKNRDRSGTPRQSLRRAGQQQSASEAQEDKTSKQGQGHDVGMVSKTARIVPT